MTTRHLARMALVLACAWPAAAQAPPPDPARPVVGAVVGGAGATAPAEPPTQEAAATGESGLVRFVKDVGSDYRNYFSQETAYWYGGGLAAASVAYFGDPGIAEAFANPPAPAQTALEGGDTYGNLTWQVPLAVGWWVTGHAMGSSRAAQAGRDLLRAQISATTWAYAIKFAVDRTRPNGDPRSFPSGHSTATFATAMVLQQHYGWKVGVPFFAAATYTAISRLTIEKHWASDVTFGAFLGMASARTVTLHVRHQKFALAPIAVPRGGGLALVHVN